MTVLDVWAQDGFAWGMAEAALRGGAVAAAAGFSIAVFRLRSAAQRSTVWKAALVASLAMPAAMVVAPPIFVRPAPAAADSHADALSPSLTPVVDVAAAPFVQSAVVPAPVVPANPPALAGVDWLTVVYAVITSVLLLRIALGWLLGARLAANARAVDVGAPFETRMSRAIAAPTTFGWPRTVVLLPENWTFWDETKLRAVLLHEGAHVARGDFIFNVLAQVHVALFWFSPVSWLLKDRLARAGEEASDDRALDVFADNAAYAEVLLSFASQRAPRLSAALAVPMAESAAARIERALDHDPTASRRIGAGSRAALAVAFAGAAYGAAAVSLAEAPPAAPRPPSAPAAPAAPASAIRPKALAPAAAPAAPVLEDELAGAEPPAAPDAPSSVDARDESADSWSWTWNKHKRRMSSLSVEPRRIEFERDGETYVITDRKLLEKVRGRLREIDGLNREQERLSAEQERCSDEQEALSDRLEEATIDSTELRARLGSEMAALQKMASKKLLSQEELSEMQERLGELQGALGEMQARAGEHQSSIGVEMSRLGAKQAEIGARQTEIGAKINEAHARLEAKLTAMIDEALKTGAAKRTD